MLSDHPPICSSNRLPPWILCIELHRMYETNGTIKESNSPVSHPTSPSITGTNSKSGRKSSLSSTSSGYSAITSFSLTTGTCSSLPHFLPLGITPLATNQQSFQGEKLVVKAKRQLQDVFSVLAGNFPSWLIQLISGFESSYTSDSDQNRGQIDKRSPTPFLSHIIHDNQPTFVTSLHGGGCSTTNFVNSSSLSDSTSLLIQLNAFSQSSFNTHLFDHSSGLSSTSSQEHKGLDNGRNNLGKCGRCHLRLALSPNFCRHKVTVN